MPLEMGESKRRTAALVVAAIAFLATAVVILRCEWRLSQRKRSRKRRCYMIIASMPLLVAFSCLIGALWPATTPLWEWAQRALESFALYEFGVLIRLLAGGESAMLLELATHVPKKYWRMPPLACCCDSCMTAHTFGEESLRRVKLCVVQFIVAVPVLSFSLFIVYLRCDFEIPRATKLLVNATATLSTMVCVYGLITLYHACMELPGLVGARVVPKFASLKALVLLSALQTQIIDMCDFRGDGYDPEGTANFIKSFALAVETPFIALLAAYSFPQTELHEADGHEKPLLPALSAEPLAEIADGEEEV